MGFKNDSNGSFNSGENFLSAPLTKVQLGVYLDCCENPDTLKYNIPILCRLPLGTDKLRYIAAVKTVLAHHRIFSSVIDVKSGTPSLVCLDREIEIAEKTVDDINAEIGAFRRPFDLENGVLIRAEYISSKNGDAFIIDVHHLIFDGTSVNIFFKQVADVYCGKETEEEQMTLFELSKAESMPGDPKKEAEIKEFLNRKFGGVDCDSKPVPDNTQKLCDNSTGYADLNFGDRITEAEIAEFTKAKNVTENALFLSAFGYTLAKYNGTKEAFFTTANHGRYDKRLASSIGMFVKTLPFYCSFEESQSPDTLIRTVYEDYYKLKNNNIVSFAEFSAEYGAKLDVSFIYQSDLLDSIKTQKGDFTLELLNKEFPVSDIEIMLLKENGGYKMRAVFNQNDYTCNFILGLINTYLNVLCGMITQERLCDISLTDEKTEALLDGFNKTEKDYDTEKTVVELFRQQARKTPDSICLVYKEKKFTYSEVDRITDSFAAKLIKLGIKKGSVAGILIPRCEYMLLASLGVLKSGAAYMPLDPTYPTERLNLMMADSGASLLITTDELNNVIDENFTGLRMNVSEIDTVEAPQEPLPTPSKDDLFILLYTSGSTGTPKGVMFAHSNTMVTAAWERDFYNLCEGANVTAYASYGFDANVFDTYATITSGAALHIISDDIRLDLPELRRYFNKNGITHSTMTTQVGRQFALMGGTETLRYLNVAGEKLTPLTPPENLKLYNLYGPTEGSILVTGFLIDKYYSDVPIGKAIDNVKLYVTDSCGRLLPPGAVGELWLSGAHVTKGYLNRPEKTAEAYGNNPFCNQKGYERVYRTGDIVRMLSDGNIQFVGRRDAQVKVRGFRVELTEIEEVIRRFTGIKDATVAAFDDPAGGKFVAAYVVSDKKIDTAALADFIGSEKPPYMVPAVIMQIDAIPLNQNQKVNRRALPVPKRDMGEIIAPQNDRQQKIYDIIAEVIGHKEFGITTDIYDAGLTSIGAVRLNVELAEAFCVPIKISDLKANETVEKLEAFIGSSSAEDVSKLWADYPITENQSGILVECMSVPDTCVYNIPVLVSLSEKTNLERLKTAVKTAINAHPFIKATLFTDGNGEIKAKRNDGAEVTAEIIKCKLLPEESELVRPFKLLCSPLYRIEIYETEKGNYLFMDFHHIISDGTSEAILFKDIDAAYSNKALAPEKYTGFDLAMDEAEIKSGERYGKAAEYWKNLLSGCETECMPKAAPESDKAVAGHITVTGDTDAEKVKKYCTENGFTENALMNSAFAFVLSRFSGKESISYATVYNGRNDSRLKNTVAFCVKTVPIAVDISKTEKTCELVKEIQSQLMGSMVNDACSFAQLSHDYGVKADIMLVYQGDNFTFDSLCGEKCEIKDLSSDTAKAPISVSVFLENNRFTYKAEYRKDKYNSEFICSLVDALDTALKKFCESESIKTVSLLSIKGEALYEKLNRNDTEIEKLFCHEMIERSAAENPEKTAVIVAGETLTYNELNRKANIMAHALIHLGVTKDSIIGLVLDRTKEVFITELAILKAGGAFLPMIPSYPDERIDYCLTNAQSPFVITTDGIKNQKASLFAEEKSYKTLTVSELLTGNETENPSLPTDPKQLAYCIYTSGSTGTPKGVMIEHHSFTNFIQTNKLLLNFYNDANCIGSAMASSSISFDMSHYEIYIPLCYGKTVCMSTEEEFHNPLLLKELMVNNRVGMMVCTPSFMNNIVSIPEFLPAIKNLKTIVVGAEAFPSSLYEALRRINPTLQIINGYGPTETTVCCSTKELTNASGITIGKPTGNYKFYVTDRFGNILPPYGVGELIICGDGVGRGYVRLPEKTAASFFFLRGIPAYHSGDLVRLNRDAEIEFGGRIDNQVKLRGFRIELDEIEKVMLSFAAVTQSKVIVRNNGSEDYLAGFFTANEKVDIAELTSHLKSRLTYYMVPAALMQLETMPLTPNGKIDKNGFPETVKQEKKKTDKKAPKKSLEQRLCDIFTSILGTEIYADDNFFECGGTSLTASKVTMVLMSDGIEVKYGDIFDNPTPEELAQFIENRNISSKAEKAVKEQSLNTNTREALKYNAVKYAAEVERKMLGNILLTGAVGFLGIHVLYELLQSEEGHIWCLVRKGSYENAEIRLKSMLIYYFGKGFDDELKNRITVIDADITDASLRDALENIPFDTVINCAACVKHFSDSDILTEINVHGVENLIDICKERDKKLVHISTVSVPGIHTEESYEKQIRMHENELFVIDDMDNKYGISKYKAELRIFDAVESGLKAKVIRVGNLMGRHSDGEFQANMETNMFISGIRGFAVMGKYPISHMTDPMRFSPVDCTAKAVVLLAGTNDKFTAFNADNRYGFDEMKIIDACNRNGITIVPTRDEDYYREFREKLGNDSVNSRLGGLAAYDIKGAHAVDTDNLFTTNILYRIGFSWPLVDDTYLDRAINSIMTLDYFNTEETDGEF